MEVNHKDENKTNNNVSNLEWCSAKYNMNYGTARDRMLEKIKKKVLCVETGKVFNSVTEATINTGVARSSIAKANSGVLKTAGGYHWKYI